MKHFLLLLIPFWLGSCSTDKEKMLAENDASGNLQGSAQVTKVTFSGEENAYTFEVTIESPDTGCEQYADWWEVIDLEGNLIYRRILDHSHVTEQPFTRSGEDIEISQDKEVYVRMHMNNSGYVAQAQKGSVVNGFQATELDVTFAKDLEKAAPLPDGCAF
jgi:hypothetical protein